MDKIETDSRWYRPLNVHQEQPGPAEYAFGIIVGIVAITLVALLAKAAGHSMYGTTLGFLTAFPILVGTNTLRARPETYQRNAFWGLRTLVYTLAIMAGTAAMLYMQDHVVNALPQPWSGMLVYLGVSYVVGLPLLLTTEQTTAVRLRRTLLYVYPLSAIVIAVAMWLFDTIIG